MTEGNNNQESNENVVELINSKLSAFEEKINSLSEKIASQETPSSETEGKDGKDGKDEPDEKLTLKSLQSQLKNMREQIEKKDRDLANANRDQKIHNFLNAKGINYSDSAYKLFLAENGENLKQENGEWFVKEGETVQSLEQKLESFIEKPEIAIYKNKLPKGGGIRQSNTSVNTSAKSTSLNDKLLDALSEIDLG